LLGHDDEILLLHIDDEVVEVQLILKVDDEVEYDDIRDD
jgi:hypothetical protein